MGKPLAERVAFREEKARERERVDDSYFATSLKDELLPHRKIDANLSRCIDGANLDYLILFRKYFGHYLSVLTENPTDACGSCVGFNPHTDFTILYNRLKSNSNVGFDVDAKRWDGTIPGDFFCGLSTITRIYYRKGLLKRLDKWVKDMVFPDGIPLSALSSRTKVPAWLEEAYALKKKELEDEFEKEQNVRDTLINELQITISVVKGELVVTCKGLPSGHPATALFNSIIHAMIAEVSWLMCTEGTEFHSLKDFDENVVFFTYGDDGVYSVKPIVFKLFNRITMRECFSYFGMTLTAANKTGAIRPLDEIEHLTFCKRSFVPDPQFDLRCLCPIEERTLNSLLNWERERGDLADNLDVYFFELSYSGLSMYESQAKKVADALSFHSVRFSIPTYLQQHERWLNMFSNLVGPYAKRTVIHKADLQLARLKAKHGVSTHAVCGVCQKTCFGLVSSKRAQEDIPGLWPRCLHCAGFVDIPKWYYE